MRELLLIAFVLACPLMMMFTMRGGHGHGGLAHGQRDDGQHSGETERQSAAELRRQRDELDRLIEERQAAEDESMHPGAGRR